MLRFFRQIRQRLFTDNKFGKYMLYAVGEILLVVIGILIALQVDNWNDYRKERKEESSYLGRIHEDLKKDNEYYQKRIDDAENYIDLSQEFKGLLTNGKQKTLEDVSEMADVFLKYAQSEMMTFYNSTYLEMLNAGKIELLTDEALKLSLLNYYRRCEEVAKHVEEFNAYSVDVINIMHDKAPSFLPGQTFTKTGLTSEGDYSYLNTPSTDKFQAIAYAAGLYGVKHGEFLDYFQELEAISTDLINRLEEFP